MLSVCVVTYNSRNVVLETLRSLAEAAGLVPMTVFVSDNASDDGTCHAVQESFPFVRLIQNEVNRGYGGANNAVLPLLDSDYHLVLNPDVVFEPEALRGMLAYMDAHPEAVLLTPHVLNPDGSEQRLPKRQPTLRYILGGLLERFGPPFSRWRHVYTGGGMDLTVPAPVELATGCFMLFRTDVFIKLGGFDALFFMYMEDADLSRRALDAGQIHYHPDFCVTHQWKRASHHSGKGRAAHIQSALRFFQKWGWHL